MPRTTSSWSFVSSRQTATPRSGSASASADNVDARRRGLSKATVVSAESRTAATSAARRGRKPTNRQRSAGSPEATTATGTDDAPGSTSTRTPASNAARMRT